MEIVNNGFFKDLCKIEKREGHLWALTLSLLMLFGVVIIFTFYFINGQNQTITNSLIGLFVLNCLFCIYAFHSRSTFGKMRKLLEYQAMRDPLTGLFNRRYFSDRMEEQKSRADRHQTILAVFLCDLDNFKGINDSEGHNKGDEV